MNGIYRRSSGFAALVATVAIGLAACGGSNSPKVASLGTNSGKSTVQTAPALPKGNPTQLLDEWASCMRSHGDPNQADPSIDANKVIHIIYPVGFGGNGQGGPGRSGPCQTYLTAASTALRGGRPPDRPDPAKLEKFSACMRANGIPDFPDPAGGGLSIRVTPGSDLNPHNPTFQSASKLCAKKAGVPAFGGKPPAGAIEATGSRPVSAGNSGSS